jgi:ATP-dependent DNA helicase RecG
MKENQHIEWKRQWSDEYFKWLCAFANADGGSLCIGVDDDGRPFPLDNEKELLQHLPTKIRDQLGIIADVNLIETPEGDYIRIDVRHSERLVSFHGHFYYRSGSTAMELTGAALEQMILQRKGSTWDAEVVPGVGIDELSEQAFERYKRKAVANGRQDAVFLRETRETILENLRLVRDGKLTRAALLLFHPEPDRFFFGATLRLGYFLNQADLIYQDEFKGPLFIQLDAFMEALYLKYLRAYIRYEGIQRIDEYLFPRAAVREAILNALIHKDYSQGISIQVKVFESQMHIYNPGRLPLGWTVDRLMGKHASVPFNPLVAEAFYTAGEIEHWGRGVEKIVNLCSASHLSLPQYEDQGMVGLFLDATEKLAYFQKTLGLKPGTAALGKDLQAGLQDEIQFETTKKYGSKNALSLEAGVVPESGVVPKAGMVPETGVVPESGVVPKAGMVPETGAKVQAKLQKVLDLFSQHPTMTVVELSKELSIGRSSVMRYTKKLQQSGALKRIGSNKNGHWEVVR